jgi:Sulfatase-modifying factor enzyme 1/Domain of unknown function (DUF4388)
MAAETARTSQEIPRSWRGFQGTLASCALFDILQMACLAQCNGRLFVRSRFSIGAVILARGQIVHAQANHTVGEDGLVEILCWQKGKFRFVDEPRSDDYPATIHRSWEQVLMEAVRKRDERYQPESAGQSLPSRPPGLSRRLGQHVASDLGLEKRKRLLRRVLLRIGLPLLCLGLLLVGAFVFHGRSGALNGWWQGQAKALARVFGLSPEWKKRIPVSVKITAGDSTFQRTETVYLPAFEIDDVEVPIWQYQEFLQAINSSSAFDHPDQPAGKKHTNPQWETYAQAAYGNQTFHGVKLTPNHPAAFIDWFDAYAFAAWRGRRLPSEQEWEKAARGTHSWIYPWGNEFDPAAANLLSSNPANSGPAPVGSFPLDRSAFRIYDTAGNVSEWTATVESNGNPVLRGGNFSKESGDLTQRILDRSPFYRDARIGFRTAK